MAGGGRFHTRREPANVTLRAMPVDPVHEAPHTSSDPAYCETWAYLLTDLERKTTLLVHERS